MGLVAHQCGEHDHPGTSSTSTSLGGTALRRTPSRATDVAGLVGEACGVRTFDKTGVVMTHSEFVKWHNHMQFNYLTGANALGVSRATYANYLKGVTATTGRRVVYTRTVALACAAIKDGLAPL